MLLRQIRALRKAGDAGAPMQAWMKKDEMVALAQRRWLQMAGAEAGLAWILLALAYMDARFGCVAPEDQPQSAANVHIAAGRSKEVDVGALQRATLLVEQRASARRRARVAFMSAWWCRMRGVGRSSAAVPGWASVGVLASGASIDERDRQKRAVEPAWVTTSKEYD